ncbi:MAG: hypothetical protein IT427_10940 [Pirellulales bacterium]|jgi:hypothetical protein|nr:hypothetical protein [Pirellulales bacterium]
MNDQTNNMIAECRRQEESCLYTATTIFEWLKAMRWWRVGFVIVPIILGALATWPLLAKQVGFEWVTGACALFAGLTPAVYKALDFDVSLDILAKSAHEFKILQDRFRQASSVTALGDFNIFKAEFDALMKRMDAARAGSLTPPERFFKKAQQKIKRGDYDFGVDLQRQDRHAT